MKVPWQGSPYLEPAALFPHHLAMLDHMHRTPVDGIVRLVPEPIFITLGTDSHRTVRHRLEFASFPVYFLSCFQYIFKSETTEVIPVLIHVLHHYKQHLWSGKILALPKVYILFENTSICQNIC